MRRLLAGTPEGWEVRALERLALQEQPDNAVFLLLVADARRARAVLDAARFFAPEMECIEYPAWDRLPYSRSVPSRGVMGRRLAALGALARKPQGRRLIVASVNAATHRVLLPEEGIAAQTLREGEHLDREDFTRRLLAGGYERVPLAREVGHFAVRGAVVDVIGLEGPARIELDDEMIASIRAFAPASQRLGAAITAVIAPLDEVPFHDAARRRLEGMLARRFPGALREGATLARFGSPMPPDDWYDWRAFARPLTTLFALAPEAMVVLDAEAAALAEERLRFVEECRQARDDTHLPEASDDNLTAQEWHDAIADAWTLSSSALSPKAAAAAAASAAASSGNIDAGGRLQARFADIRAQSGIVRALEQFAEAARARSDAHFIAAAPSGLASTLREALSRVGSGSLHRIESWADLPAEPTGGIAIASLDLVRGMEAPGIVIATAQDLLGRAPSRARAQAVRAQVSDDPSALTPGDLAVHETYGLGRFVGLETIGEGAQARECAALEYRDKARVLVPVENMGLIARYGASEGSGELDRLGAGAWNKRKARARSRIKILAEKLMRAQARRELANAPILVAEPEAMTRFLAGFPYEETESQLLAVEETLADLAASRPMDRLICGDVGFGKTEVALRAALACVMSGRQVLLVAPTTLLANQHEVSFRERFRPFPVRLARLTRLTPAPERRQALDDLTSGVLDIAIGAHALLGRGVKPRRLGLVVIDEEQRFGVGAKEKLRALSSSAHVLSLTATPIPRTLELALAGLRAMSVIDEAPSGRLGARISIAPFDEITARQFLMREKARGGRTFVVRARVRDLESERVLLERVVPELSVAMAHGAMPAEELEKAVRDFRAGACDILLATNIVESGLDIPGADSILVRDADRFGLAQLHQLRGRVGRAQRLGYAWFALSDIGGAATLPARRRLDALASLDQLGAGFQLAARDLDLRGAGDLLGADQSGHVRDVGVSLYQSMLSEAVATARKAAMLGGDEGDDDPDEAPATALTIGAGARLPEAWIPDQDIRFGLYRRLAKLEDDIAIDAFAGELEERFASIPDAARQLLDAARLRGPCRQAGVSRLDMTPSGMTLTLRSGGEAWALALAQWVATNAEAVQLRPNGRMLVRLAGGGDRVGRLHAARKTVEGLAALHQQAREA